MTLLDKIKSLLGMGGSDSTDEERDVGVTVEREGPSTETENAVKGANAGSSPVETDGDVAGTESQGDPAAVPAETGSDVEAESPVKEAEPAADEDAEAETEPESEPEVEDEPEAGAATGDDAEAEESVEGEGEDEADRIPSEAVDVIKGIGPTYADRLANAGIETVADLAAADPDEVTADVPRGRLEDWIERAKARQR